MGGAASGTGRRGQELLAPGLAVVVDVDDVGHVWCPPLNGDGLKVLRHLVEQALELRVADKSEPGRGHNNRPASHGGHSDEQEVLLVPRNDEAAE